LGDQRGDDFVLVLVLVLLLEYARERIEDEDENDSKTKTPSSPAKRRMKAFVESHSAHAGRAGLILLSAEKCPPA
jgi:hypothetical protein